MYNRYRKLCLSCDDFPDDPDVLREGIGKLVKTALGGPRDIVITCGNLTPSETMVIRYLLAGKQVTTGRQATDLDLSMAVYLKSARKKLASLGITIPKRRKEMAAHDRAKLALLVEEATKEQNSNRSKLEEILPFLSTRYESHDLPEQSQELKIIVLKLMQLLRGHPESINIPDITSPSFKIILSALLAREKGVVTDEQLFMALYTPFTDNPVLLSTVASHLGIPRRLLEKKDIYITNSSSRGNYIDDINRDRLYAINKATDTFFSSPEPPATDHIGRRAEPSSLTC